jgi:ADP-ribose pyrophosphatase
VAVENSLYTLAYWKKGPEVTEQRIDGTHVYEGRILKVRVDRVRLDNGRETTREVVEHPGAVAILPILNDGSMLLIRQYRYAIGRELLEVPAGTREPGEPAEVTARRELEEETGKRAGRIELLTRFYISPGWCNEQIVIYRAHDLVDTETNLDDDEVIDLVRVTPEEVPGLVASGEIADGKTITALMYHLKNGL